MRYMSRNCCNTTSSCCNPCDGYGIFSFGGAWLYILAIMLIFGGGGFCPGSFWGGYNNIFRCSGFNNGWCDNIDSNNFNSNSFSSGYYSNSTLSSNNISNTNFANLLSSLSNNLSSDSNFDIASLTESSN